jgi:hypothetical protein
MEWLCNMYASSTERRWFDVGAAALDQLLIPKLGDKYVCPLCRNSFDRSQIATELTVEHAPPSSIGGRAVALTCRVCNSSAGSQLDAELVHRHKARRLTRRGTAVFENVETIHEGTLARGRLTIGPRGMKFDPIERQNHFERLREHIEVSSRWAQAPQAGREITMRIPIRGNPRRADLSLVRAAFLVAFATFGYVYALQPSFEVLINQLHLPNEPLIDPLPIFYDDSSPDDLRQIALVTNPHLLRSVMIRIGPAAIFLPSERDDDFFEDFDNRRSEVAAGIPNRAAFSLGVERFDWPTSPQHLWDGVDREAT